MSTNKQKLIRITTVPISLEKLLEGQLTYMQDYYKVTAIASECERLDNYGRENGIATYCIEMSRKITPIQDLRAIYKLFRYLKKEKPAILHSHTPKAGLVGMTASYLARVPHRLHTVAGLPLMEATGFKRKVLNTVERFIYKCATAVYPNSKGLEDFILEQKFTAKSKLKIIGNGSSNGIDISHFDPIHFPASEIDRLRSKLGVSPNDFIYVFVGRLVSDKGINELVKAFIGVNDSHPKTALVLVGNLETDLDPLFKSTLDNIENHPKIYATGFQKDVRPYYAFAKALVFPSYREGFPNVVMQAGAMGLPAIVTNINGCNEIVAQEENGLVVPAKNVNKLEEAMSRLYLEPELYKRLKLQARSQIIHKYGRAQIWQEILKEYKALEKH